MNNSDEDEMKEPLQCDHCNGCVELTDMLLDVYFCQRNTTDDSMKDWVNINICHECIKHLTKYNQIIRVNDKWNKNEINFHHDFLMYGYHKHELDFRFNGYVCELRPNYKFYYYTRRKTKL